MRLFLLVLALQCVTFYFCTAQVDNSLNDCSTLESIMNTGAVKSFLVSYGNNARCIIAESGYFLSCNSLNIDNISYKIVDTIRAKNLEYKTMELYIRIDSKYISGITIENVPWEVAGNFDVKKVNGKYIVKLIRIDNLE